MTNSSPASPAVSEAEQRASRARRRVGLILAPAVFLITLAVPMPSLDAEAHTMAAIALLVVILWVTEAIPLAVSALLGPALAVALSVAPAQRAFAPFAHPLIFLFLGGFILARALSVHGIDRRAALWMLSRDVIRGSPSRALVAVASVTFVFSMWISNTATTAMMVPIALGLCSSIRRFADIRTDESDRSMRHARFEEGMLITLAYAASMGGVCTPIGTAPNLVAIEALGSDAMAKPIDIDFLEWMSFALPIACVAMLGLLAFATKRFRPAVEHIDGLSAQVRTELSAMGPMRPADIRVVVVFSTTVLGWLLPSILRLWLGEAHTWTTWAGDVLHEGVVAILGAIALFVVPRGRDPTATGADAEPDLGLIRWRDAVRIDWGTLFLLGGAISMGGLVFRTGLAEAIAEATVGSDALPGGAVMLLAASTVLVLYMTELTSNTATTSMMLPVLIPVAQRAGADPIPVALAVTIAASFAFMLPVSTPPNAIAYGTTKIRLGSMIRFGAWLDLAAIGLLVAAGLWFLPLFAP